MFRVRGCQAIKPTSVKWFIGPNCVRTKGAIHSTKISGNFGPKLNGSVRSNRKSFEKTGPPFEVVLFSRSDQLEFWLNGSRRKEERQGWEDQFALSFAQTMKIQLCPVNLEIAPLFLQNWKVAYCNGNISYYRAVVFVEGWNWFQVKMNWTYFDYFSLIMIMNITLEEILEMN